MGKFGTFVTQVVLVLVLTEKPQVNVEASDTYGIDNDRYETTVDREGNILLPGGVSLREAIENGNFNILTENASERGSTKRDDNRKVGDHCQYRILAPVPTRSNGSDNFVNENFVLDTPVPAKDNFDVPGCYYKTPDRVHLVCSSKEMTVLPTNWPRRLDTLEVVDTSVTTIPCDALNGTSVKMIILSGNSIRKIERDSFGGLRDLLYLSIERNDLTGVTLDMFAGLNQLVTLILENNKLEFRNDTPDTNTTYLPLLTYLNLAKNPIKYIGKYTFKPLRQSRVEEVNLQGCSLEYIDPEAFLPLRRLRHVDFFDNPGLLNIFSTSFGPSFSSIQHLGLAYNMMDRIPAPFLQKISLTLNTLNLARNSFFRLRNSSFPVMHRLSTLILEGCGIASVEPGTFASLPKLSTLYMGRNRLTQLPAALVLPSLSFLSLRENPDQVLDGGQSFNMNDGFGQLTNLVWLELNYMKVSEIRLTAFANLTRLSILQLRGSNLPKIHSEALVDQTSLKFLDLGENEMIDIFSYGVFTGLDKLGSLFLDQCSLAPSAKKHTGKVLNVHTVFSSLTSLRQLYLAHNEISETGLSSVTLDPLPTLEVLDLHGNNLESWPTGTISNGSYLKSLDLSMNKISFLGNGTFDEFLPLTAINMADNPFLCHCQLEALHQLANVSKLYRWNDLTTYTCLNTTDFTRHHIQNLTEFECGAEPTQLLPEEIDETLTGDSIATTSAIVAGVLGTAVVVSLVSYYSRYHVRRLINMRKHKDSELAADLNYDAFISFSEEDRVWVYENLVPEVEVGEKVNIVQDVDSRSREGYRLCLHDRDFIPGQKITDNIMQAISTSRKVVVILSNSYIRSQWCMYEIELAQQFITEEGRGQLVVVLLEPIPKKDQPKNLRYLLRTRTYLEWTPDMTGRRQFWKRLIQVLGEPIFEVV